ncbi:PilC/PilY family type IV pilus protein [Acinetobacter johnsonii]|uniref:PilC/PilY family type IV pilus protein n=1 Tax=Acinetobacter johnsonii TaxID=40214 RepID=UPI001F34CD91|nr:PilC/PilY family type IV pilus protein [Acinetobacter johnsonii]
MQLKKIQMTILSASLTALMCSSVTQASDLQIYAMPTAGQKTIVMMLDTSGSMENGTGVSGVNRLHALKNGLYDVLNSTDPKLENVVVGLGQFPLGSNSQSGKILVPAVKLGAPARNGQPESAQRQALRTAVRGLSANGGTPTSHGYTEAASYLMGTRTDDSMVTLQKKTYYQKYRNEKNQKQCATYESGWSTLTYNSEIRFYKACEVWGTTNVSFSNSDYEFRRGNDNERRYYTIKSNSEDVVVYSNSTYSGFNDSVEESKEITNGITHYKSPLPIPEKRVSCDGQGVYVLSDGEPNASSDENAELQMKVALAQPTTNVISNDFFCDVDSSTLTNPLTGGNTGGAWKCMGEFAKKLFSNANPAGVKIQTAFVGFGSSFNNLNSTASNGNDIRNACKLGSRTKGDSCSYYQADGLTVNPVSYKNHIGGYGNGGFYTGNAAADVTTSVLNFIDNLGTDPLEPLPTGALSVPVDSLNPNGLQNLGYLRMLEPNPAQPSLLTWAGNLKKYTMKDGVLVDSTTNVFDTTGNFNTNTKNLWGARSLNDGGKVYVGGTYEMLPMPTTTKTTALRNVMTDVGSATETALVPLITNNTNGSYDQAKSLLKIVKTENTISKEEVLNTFRNQTTLKDFPISIKLKLLNYLGFKVDTSLEAIPANDDVSYEGSPYTSMGGIIHSFPVQMTYSGRITATGELATDDITLPDGTILKPRNQSVLYGSMEGGLHIVDAATGVEQMVFVPAEILNNTVASNALVKSGSGTPAPAHGVDAPWIVDSTYRTTGTYPNSQVNAIKMNVYGGLRMGGNSFYGLDVLNPTEPKLKFRVGSDQADYTRMGQSWSKPVLIDIRYQGVPTRALVVGGGYDACYEDPRFVLSGSSTANDTSSCTAKTRAKGNAVYVIDAETGKRLFWVSNTGSDANNADLRHSVVSRISTLDRDGDSYVDHLYFGDLGGQVFRVDMDNYQTKSLTTTGGTTSTSYSNFGVRTVRLANLATTSTGTAITNGDNPRFYEPVTLTIHDEDSKTFIHVGAASGDRSTPLDVAPTIGRDGLSPYVALTNRPTNRVYGLFDLDFMKEDLITNTALTGNYTSTTTETDVPTKNRLITRNLTLADLLGNPQTSITENETIYSKFFSTTAPKHGWYRSLSWSWDTSTTGAEVANNTFRQSGGLKAFEEPIAIGNNLFVPVYDPEGTGVTPQNPCLPRVIGETDRQQYCLPFGICLTAVGIIDLTREKDSGFRLEATTGGYKNANVVGKGIQGIALANNGGGGGGSNSCGNYTLATLNDGVGNWQCTRVLNPTRWFEKR